tara:strand:+ start:796 stop:1413 length:618 start_codon:yes stop_codon:yes gene_type:complete
MNISLRTVAFFLLMTVILVAPSIRAEVKEATVTIDATNREAFAFFSFDTGKEVPVEDQNISLDWDLGLKRTEVIVNGGSSGNGKGGALILEKAKFSEITEAPADGYVSDTEKIATLARGDGWYNYTGPPTHQILIRDKVFILQTAKGHYAKMFFVDYYKEKVSGHITISYAYQDDGSRSFVQAKKTAVDFKDKLATTWALLKTHR